MYSQSHVAQYRRSMKKKKNGTFSETFSRIEDRLSLTALDYADISLIKNYAFIKTAIAVENSTKRDSVTLRLIIDIVLQLLHNLHNCIAL